MNVHATALAAADPRASWLAEQIEISRRHLQQWKETAMISTLAVPVISSPLTGQPCVSYVEWEMDNCARYIRQLQEHLAQRSAPLSHAGRLPAL